MIKHFIITCLTVAPSLLWAQEAQENSEEPISEPEVLGDFRPVGGEKTIELQFAPFGDNPIDINGIRARWFSSQRKAFRLNIFVGLSSDTEITQQENDDADLKELKDKSFALTFNIRPGFEKHLRGIEKLSPYFGWEADLAYRTSSFKSEVQVGDDVNYNKVINSSGYFRVGANLLAGVDFYMVKKLYLGAELGFGASFTKLLPVKVKSDIDGFEEPDPQKRGNSLDFGPNVEAQIRLGYAF